MEPLNEKSPITQEYGLLPADARQQIVYRCKTIFWLLPDITFIRISFIYIRLYTFILHSRSLLQILKMFMFTTKYVTILEVLIEKGSAAVSCDANRTKTVCRTVKHINSFLLKSIT